MSEAGHQLFSTYMLELLSDAEKQNDVLEAYIRGMVVRAAATETRMSNLEEEIGQLHDAITEHALNKTNFRYPSNN